MFLLPDVHQIVEAVSSRYNLTQLKLKYNARRGLVQLNCVVDGFATHLTYTALSNRYFLSIHEKVRVSYS